MKKIFSLFAAVLVAGSMMATPVAGVLDFDNAAGEVWNLPEVGQKLVSDTVSYSDGVNTIELGAVAGGSYHFHYTYGEPNYWALFFGKTGAYVSTSVSYNVAKIQITGGTGGSGSTVFELFANDVKIGSHTSSKDGWEVIVPAANQTAGTVYKLQVTNNANAQITKMVLVEAISGAPDVPVFGLEAGTYSSEQTVSLTCSTDGAEIRYTLDGTEPTATSTLYTEEITITETTTVKAIAVKNGISSATVSATYTIISLDGEGTQANPYTIADVKKLNNPGDTAVWVEGTIVGFYANNKPVAGIEDAAVSNLAIATGTDTIPVALPTGDIRTALNLVDNPTNLGVNVKVKGDLVAYFSTTGVKNVSGYELETPSAIENTEAEVKALKVIENGQVVILKDGKRFNIVGAEL